MREKRWGSFFQDKVTGEAKIECDELVQRLQEKGIANPLVERSRCICRANETCTVWPVMPPPSPSPKTIAERSVTSVRWDYP